MLARRHKLREGKKRNYANSIAAGKKLTLLPSTFPAKICLTSISHTVSFSPFGSCFTIVSAQIVILSLKNG